MSTKTEREQMHELALRTTERIEAQAAAVRLLLQHDGETSAEIAGGDDPELHEAVAAARQALELADIGGDDDVAEGVEDWLDRSRYEGPLSISRHGVNHGDGWSTESVQIVLGTGGPHVEVQYRGDRATVVAYGWFGADRVEMPVDSDAVNLIYSVDHLYNDEEG